MPAPAQVTMPSDLEVRVTRQFDAPRQLVWDAHTKPELAQRWLGYDGWEMPINEMDVRVGGTYRWQWRNKEDGMQFGFHGTFSEVQAPSRLMHDQHFDPGTMGGAMATGEPTIITLELSEKGGVTTLVCTMRYASKESRDGAISTGMTDGMEFSYSRLDALASAVANAVASA